MDAGNEQPPPETRGMEFTRDALLVFADAQQEARDLENRHIGTTHLLLGILRRDDLAGQVLEGAGIGAGVVREALVAVDRPGVGSPPGVLPMTANSNAAIKLAQEAADEDRIDTDHLLEGILRTEAGLAVQVLARLGLEPAQILRSLGWARARLNAEKFNVFDDQGQGESVSPEPETEDEPKRDEGAVPTHADRPATADSLGRRQLAEILAERIRRTRGEDTEVPVRTRAQRRKKLRRDWEAAQKPGNSDGVLVHLHAPWGAGKSSLLNFLAEELRNRGPRRKPAQPNLSQWIVVEFSAWKHQRLVTPWWWLLATVRRGCGRELRQISLRRWAWFWTRDVFWRAWNLRAAALTLLLIAAVGLAAWQFDWFGLPHQSLSTVQAIVLTCGSALALATTVVGMLRGTSRWLAVGSAEGAVKFLKRAHDPLDVYRSRFASLVRTSRWPLAVFIDDLDRCQPEYVVELLEGIQTLFGDQPVTYVVAADRGWLCQSFARAYCDFEETAGEPGRPLGFFFLDKTFQVSLQVPAMSATTRSSYWSELMRDARGAGNGHDPGPAGNGRHEDAELRTRFATASSQEEVESTLEALRHEDLEEDAILSAAVRRLNAPELQRGLESLLHPFAPLIESNPRSMKRVMNAYGFERDRLLREGQVLSPTERRQLALLTIVRLRWPELAEHLQRRPMELEYFLDASTRPANGGHKFAALFDDAELLAVLRGDGVNVSLDGPAFSEFPAPREAAAS
jgi:hypothetical protein